MLLLNENDQESHSSFLPSNSWTFMKRTSIFLRSSPGGLTFVISRCCIPVTTSVSFVMASIIALNSTMATIQNWHER